MYEIRNASYIELDFRFTYELCSVPNIIGVIYATHTMGAVRYKEENDTEQFRHFSIQVRYIKEDHHHHLSHFQ